MMHIIRGNVVAPYVNLGASVAHNEAPGPAAIEESPQRTAQQQLVPLSAAIAVPKDLDAWKRRSVADDAAVRRAAITYCLQTPGYEPVLHELAQSGSHQFRDDFMACLTLCKPPFALSYLVGFLTDTVNVHLRYEAAGALCAYSISVAQQPILDTLETLGADNPDPAVVARLLSKLVEEGDEAAYWRLATLLEEKKLPGSQFVAASVARAPRQEAMPFLRALAASSDSTLCLYAARGLARIADVGCLPSLELLVHSQNWSVLCSVVEGCLKIATPPSLAIVRSIVARAEASEKARQLYERIAACGTDEAMSILSEALPDTAHALDRIPVQQLLKSQSSQAVILLRRIVKQGTVEQRSEIAHATEKIISPCMLTLVAELIYDDNEGVSQGALSSLEKSCTPQAAAALSLNVESGETDGHCRTLAWHCAEQISTPDAQLALAILLEHPLITVQRCATSALLENKCLQGCLLLQNAWHMNPCSELITAAFADLLEDDCAKVFRRQFVDNLLSSISSTNLEVNSRMLCRLSLYDEQTRGLLVSLLLEASSDALEKVFTSVPLRTYLLVRGSIAEVIRKKWPKDLADVREGRFDPAVLENRLVAYLMLLFDPHVAKFLESSTEFNMAAWQQQLLLSPKRKSVNQVLDNRALDECSYLAYETWQLHRKALQPAAQRAQALGLPLLVIANLSYGGSALTGCNDKDMRRLGARFLATKQSSRLAHYAPQVLEENLFNREDIAWIAKNTPLIVVVDGSRKGHYPDAFQGYHNYFLVLDAVRGVAPGKHQHIYNTDEDTLLFSSDGQRLKNKLRDIVTPDPAAVPYDFACLSVDGNANCLFSASPPQVDWQRISGPTVICVSPIMSHRRIANSNKPQALATMKAAAHGNLHEAAFFDDKTEWQQPVTYLSRHGVLKLAPPIHPDTRKHFKHLMSLAPQATGSKVTVAGFNLGKQVAKTLGIRH